MQTPVLQRSDTEQEAGLRRLTTREIEVLGSMAAGKTNAAIATDLFLTRRAVEKHINAIFSKLLLTGDLHRHARVHAVLLYLAASDRDQRIPPAGAPPRGDVRRPGSVAQSGPLQRQPAARPGRCRHPLRNGMHAPWAQQA